MSRSHKKSQPQVRVTGDAEIPPATAQSTMDMLRKLAQIISSNFGVEVVFRGAQAYTDGKTIVVPSLSENAPADLIEAIIGFVDHEVGHVMFTDMDYWMNELNAEARTGDPRIIKMTNAVEDVRQEYLMGLEYKGAGYNLDRTHEWALKRLTKQWNDPHVDSLFKFSVLLIAQAKAYQDVPCYIDFLDKHKAGFEQLLAAVDHEMRNFIHLKDVRASRDAAERILKLLDDMQSAAESQQQKQKSQADQNQQGQPGEQGQGGNKGKKGDAAQNGSQQSRSAGDQSEAGDAGDEQSGGSGQSDENAGGDESGNGDSGQSDGDDGADSGADGSAGAGDDQNDQAGQGGSDGDGNDGGDGDASADGSDGGDQGGAASPRHDKVNRDLDTRLSPDEIKNLKGIGRGSTAGGFANGGSMHEYIAGQIAYDSGDAKGHRPYSTECDLVVPPIGDGTLEMYNRKLDRIRDSVAVISKVLTRTLIAQSKAQVMRGRHSGRVSLNNLAQMRAKQTNVFEVVREGKKLDTYVEIIVDHSGSMKAHGKIEVAEQTCIALAEALEKVGVPFGISGFTAGLRYPSDDPSYKDKQRRLMEARMNGETDNYERVDPIIEFVYKSPDQRLAQVRPQLALMTQQWCGCNADGDSIYKIAKRVAQRPEKRKLLMVLSDGWPAAAQGDNVVGEADERYMAHVAKALDNSKGFEIVGIGIMSDAVKNYYRRNFVLKSIDQLPQLAMTELRRVLLDKPDANAA